MILRFKFISKEQHGSAWVEIRSRSVVSDFGQFAAESCPTLCFSFLVC